MVSYAQWRATTCVCVCLAWLVLITAIGPLVSPARAVDAWITSGDRSRLLSQQKDAVFQPGVGSGGLRIDVRSNETYQTIEGFGAAMTDSSAWVFDHLLDSEHRHSLMGTLFSPDQGIGISYLRLPMGASDFTASGLYSYDDQPSGHADADLSDFSIDHDRQSIIPRLQEAKAFNPALKIMGSPWSAPAWMKTSGSMIGGSLDPQWSDSYALYFKKFIQAYADEGLPIDTVSLQNEPLYVPGNYPGMGMSSAQQTDLIKNHFGPLFAQSGIDTKILAYDHNWDVSSYPIDVLDDPVANQYVAGTAFHGYGGTVDAQGDVHDAYPDKGIYFTEFSGGTWAPSFSSNLVNYTRDLFINGTRNWSKNVMLWNLALDEDGDPHQGGCVGCRGVVTVDSSSGDVTLNEEFYAIGQASKFIMPGAVRVSSNTRPGMLEAVAFLNPDNSRVLLSLNPSNQTQTLRLVYEGEHFTYNVPPLSVATFVWNDDGADFDNGGFEEGGYETTGGSLDAWQTWGDSGGNIAVTDAMAFEGDHSLRLSGQSVNSNVFGVFQGASVTAGQQVRADLSWLIPTAESLVGSESSVQVKLEYYSEFGASHDSVALLGETVAVIADADAELGNWEPYELTDVAPAGAVEARLVLFFDKTTPATGAVYLDAISLTSVPLLTGDYDGNGVVDAADYTVWRDNFGTTNKLPNDPIGGTISESQFVQWRTNFGATNAIQRTLASAIPEPSALELCLVGGFFWTMYFLLFHANGEVRMCGSPCKP
jgi:glucosylceramidase